MCGIIGYIGSNHPIQKLVNGLENLEYRGYDSAGVALLNQKNLQVIKCAGKIRNLKEKIEKTNVIACHLGIAHTRWATHGIANTANAHPHTVGKVTVVHNGIIENEAILRKKLKKEGYSFQTETDTEVIAALLDSYRDEGILVAIQKMYQEVVGSYALGIVVEGDSNHLYAIRKASPLFVGISDTGFYITSDVGAILQDTNRYFLLEEGEIAILSQKNVKVLNQNGKIVKKKVLTCDESNRPSSKQKYAHYMLKEMLEEPKLLENLLDYYAKTTSFFLKNFPDISAYEEIHIVACGSALYAGMIGKYLLEEKAKIPVRVEVASEYRYQHTLYNHKTLVLLISQSGETADTIASLNKAKENGIDTMGIVNVEMSTIAREVDHALFLHAGREVAVATTKAYLLQVALLSLLALKAGVQKKFISNTELEEIFIAFRKAPSQIQAVLDGAYRTYAKQLSKQENVFFLGRGMDYAICLEGSLKLKEISYIHSEAYQAGELKHGTISLIREKTPVLAVITNPELSDKTISNLKETEARGADTMVVVTDSIKDKIEGAKIIIPKTHVFVQTLLVVPALQMLAYEVAKERGCEIDQPKNLAKSVTVE